MEDMIPSPSASSRSGEQTAVSKWEATTCTSSIRRFADPNAADACTGGTGGATGEETIASASFSESKNETFGIKSGGF